SESAFSPSGVADGLWTTTSVRCAYVGIYTVVYLLGFNTSSRHNNFFLGAVYGNFRYAQAVLKGQFE
ncbi:MAG: hypothetical protein AAGJ30_01155, partial [Pseudomonadota bacterium]